MSIERPKTFIELYLYNYIADTVYKAETNISKIKVCTMNIQRTLLNYTLVILSLYQCTNPEHTFPRTCVYIEDVKRAGPKSQAEGPPENFRTGPHFF